MKIETLEIQWEKELREKLRRFYIDQENTTDVECETVKTISYYDIENFIRALLTSHDAYWKKKVERSLIAMSWMQKNETSEAIRVINELMEKLVRNNEDNLEEISTN